MRTLDASRVVVIVSRVSDVIGMTVIGALALLAYFPGGSLIMWLGCLGEYHSGLDWILSAALPFFGLVSAAQCQF